MGLLEKRNQLIEKEIEMRESSQESKQLQLSSDQAIEALNRILNKQMSQSEAELMRAENMELKKQLATFTINYEKFAQLVMNTLQMHGQMLEKEQIELKENVLKISKENLQKISELKSNSQVLNESLKEVMISNVNKSISQSLAAIAKNIDRLSEASLQRIEDINKIVDGYKKEFEGYKEKMGKKTNYYEKRNNVRDLIFFISVFSMPVYVIIEIYLKFFAK